MTSLPSDSTLAEIDSVFSKCGVIAEEIDRGQPRIKMYEDDEGNFKGDALIVYFRPESVNLAIQMLDDTSLRLGEAEKMRVQAADFSYKSQQEKPSGGGNKRDQKKVIKKTQKLNKYMRHGISVSPELTHCEQQTRRLERRRDCLPSGNQLPMGQSRDIEAHVHTGRT